MPDYESKHLIQSKHYLAITKTSVCFQHYSHTKSKRQHCTSCWEEINCIPAKTWTMCDVSVMNCGLQSQYFLCLWCRSWMCMDTVISWGFLRFLVRTWVLKDIGSFSYPSDTSHWLCFLLDHVITCNAEGWQLMKLPTIIGVETWDGCCSQIVKPNQILLCTCALD